MEITNFLTEYNPKILEYKFTEFERSNKDSLLNIKEKNRIKRAIYRRIFLISFKLVTSFHAFELFDF